MKLINGADLVIRGPFGTAYRGLPMVGQVTGAFGETPRTPLGGWLIRPTIDGSTTSGTRRQPDLHLCVLDGGDIPHIYPVLILARVDCEAASAFAQLGLPEHLGVRVYAALGLPMAAEQVHRELLRHLAHACVGGQLPIRPAHPADQAVWLVCATTVTQLIADGATMTSPALTRG